MALDQEQIRERRARRAQQQNQPFRFWMPPGTERKIIVLDDQPEDFFYRYEHAVFNPDTNRNDIYLDCADDSGTCPVCANTDSKPYYALYLTVIDLEPYTNKNGEEIEWSRKLFVVKSGMQRPWVREAEREGGLRGKVYRIFRDAQTDPVTGHQIELDLDEEPYTEEQLAEFVREYTDREGKVHVEDCSQPFDYDAIMPEMSIEELAAAVGGAPATPGSRAAEDEAFDDDAPWDDAEEEIDASADEEWDEEDEEDEEEEYEESEEDYEEEADEEEEVEEEDEPAPRRAGRAARAASSRSTSRASARGTGRASRREASEEKRRPQRRLQTRRR